MAKGSNKEAKEEGEISDDESEEKRVPVLNPVPHPQAHGLEFQALNSVPPSHFVGRSNRPKPKVGHAKFLRGPYLPQPGQVPSYGKRLPSPKRALSALQPLRGILKNPSRQSNSVSNNEMLDRQGINSGRPSGIERMLNVPNKDTINSGIPKQSPGAKCILFLKYVR